MRASAVIEEAAAKLESQSVQVSEQLSARVQNYLNDATQQMQALQDEVRKHHQNYVAQSTAMLEHQKLEFFAHLDRSYEDVKLKCDHIEYRFNELVALMNNHAKLDQYFADFAKLANERHNELLTSHVQFEKKLQEFSLQLASSQSLIATLAKR